MVSTSSSRNRLELLPAEVRLHILDHLLQSERLASSEGISKARPVRPPPFGARQNVLNVAQTSPLLAADAKYLFERIYEAQREEYETCVHEFIKTHTLVDDISLNADGLLDPAMSRVDFENAIGKEFLKYRSADKYQHRDLEPELADIYNAVWDQYNICCRVGAALHTLDLYLHR